VVTATKGVIFLEFSQNSILGHLSFELCAGFSDPEPLIPCLEIQAGRKSQSRQTLTGTLQFADFRTFEIAIGEVKIISTNHAHPRKLDIALCDLTALEEARSGEGPVQAR
jgi:hypothetical protein